MTSSLSDALTSLTNNLEHLSLSEENFQSLPADLEQFHTILRENSVSSTQSSNIVALTDRCQNITSECQNAEINEKITAVCQKINLLASQPHKLVTLVKDEQGTINEPLFWKTLSTKLIEDPKLKYFRVEGIEVPIPRKVLEILNVTEKKPPLNELLRTITLQFKDNKHLELSGFWLYALGKEHLELFEASTWGGGDFLYKTKSILECMTAIFSKISSATFFWISPSLSTKQTEMNISTTPSSF